MASDNDYNDDDDDDHDDEFPYLYSVKSGACNTKTGQCMKTK